MHHCLNSFVSVLRRACTWVYKQANFSQIWHYHLGSCINNSSSSPVFTSPPPAALVLASLRSASPGCPYPDEKRPILSCVYQVTTGSQVRLRCISKIAVGAILPASQAHSLCPLKRDSHTCPGTIMDLASPSHRAHSRGISKVAMAPVPTT